MYSSKANKNQLTKSDVQPVREGDDRINSLASLCNEENLH